MIPEQVWRFAQAVGERAPILGRDFEIRLDSRRLRLQTVYLGRVIAYDWTTFEANYITAPNFAAMADKGIASIQRVMRATEIEQSEEAPA